MHLRIWVMQQDSAGWLRDASTSKLAHLHLYRYTPMTRKNVTQSKDVCRWQGFVLNIWKYFFVILQDCAALHKPFPKSRPENPDHKVTQTKDWAPCLWNTFQKQFGSIKSDDIHPINCLRKAAGQIPLFHLANYNLWRAARQTVYKRLPIKKTSVLLQKENTEYRAGLIHASI